MAVAPPSVRDRLRTRGLRVTQPRVAVLGWLANAGSPRSHAEVVEGLESQGWDRATLFRNLTDLVAAGLVRRLDVGDHVWRFELVEDSVFAADGAPDAHPGPAGHAHFVCTDCGEVQCLPALQVQAPEGAARLLLDRTHEIQIRGVCAACDPSPG